MSTGVGFLEYGFIREDHHGGAFAPLPSSVSRHRLRSRWSTTRLLSHRWRRQSAFFVLAGFFLLGGGCGGCWASSSDPSTWPVITPSQFAQIWHQENQLNLARRFVSLLSDLRDQQIQALWSADLEGGPPVQIQTQSGNVPGNVQRFGTALVGGNGLITMDLTSVQGQHDQDGTHWAYGDVVWAYRNAEAWGDVGGYLIGVRQQFVPSTTVQDDGSVVFDARRQASPTDSLFVHIEFMGTGFGTYWRGSKGIDLWLLQHTFTPVSWLRLRPILSEALPQAYLREHARVETSLQWDTAWKASTQLNGLITWSADHADLGKRVKTAVGVSHRFTVNHGVHWTGSKYDSGIERYYGYDLGYSYFFERSPSSSISVVARKNDALSLALALHGQTVAGLYYKFAFH